jgi:hypothetical protein
MYGQVSLLNNFWQHSQQSLPMSRRLMPYYAQPGR